MKFLLTHTILYAKGWYAKSNDVFVDLKNILKLDNYTPFTDIDVYRILLSSLEEFIHPNLGWVKVSSILYGIHPIVCWKYGYYVEGTDMDFVPKNKKLEQYDMQKAFVYYLLNNLRYLEKEYWNVKIPAWKLYPKHPDRTINNLYNCFVKNKVKEIA